MIKLNSEIRVILIGGSSHIGKTTLGKSLADKLDWNYVSTDSLGKHPGRPWIDGNTKVVKEHVAKHYKSLSVEDLLSDVLLHYQQNTLPQVETLVNDCISNLSNKHLLIEGSALYPRFIKYLIDTENVLGIWFIASDRLFKNRILQESNYYNVDEEKKYLIQKFLARTLLYNQKIEKDISDLNFNCIHVESVKTLEELMQQCLKKLTFINNAIIL